MTPTTKTQELARLVQELTISGQHEQVRTILATASRSVKPVLQQAVANATASKTRQDIVQLLSVGNSDDAWQLAGDNPQLQIIIRKWFLDKKVAEVVPVIVAKYRNETDYNIIYRGFNEIDVRDEKNGIRFYMTTPRSNDIVSCWSDGNIGCSDLIKWDKMAAFVDLARIVYKLQDEIATALFEAIEPLKAYEARKQAEAAQHQIA